MEELFFDVYEKRFSKEDYSADTNENINTPPKQKEKDCLDISQNIL